MELVFVTNNPNKLNEIQSLVSHEIFIKSLKDIDFHNEIDETDSLASIRNQNIRAFETVDTTLQQSVDLSA